jgi:hypothetical protein
MNTSDPVADVAPDTPTASTPAKSPPVSSPNSFFIYLLIVVGFLLYHRLAWEAVLLIAGGRLSDSAMKIIFYFWLIPIAAILGSIIVPSLGTTTLWLVGGSVAASIPLTLGTGYTLLFGNRTNLTA